MFEPIHFEDNLICNKQFKFQSIKLEFSLFKAHELIEFPIFIPVQELLNLQ